MDLNWAIQPSAKRSDVTGRGNKSVVTEIDPPYTTSYLPSIDIIGLSGAVLSKTNYFLFSRIRNCMCKAVHIRQLGRHLERFGCVRTES